MTGAVIRENRPPGRCPFNCKRYNSYASKIHRKPTGGLMEEHSFDGLAKEMADGAITRSRALKLVGAAILGSAFAGLAPATAGAQATAQGRNKVAVVCSRGFNFFNGTTLRNCRSRAGNSRFTCTPNFSAFNNNVACRSGGNRYHCRARASRFNEVLLICKKRRKRRRHRR